MLAADTSGLDASAARALAGGAPAAAMTADVTAAVTGPMTILSFMTILPVHP
ncbi:hypothetical protein Plo01_73470 [Planobispora longispora]|uniref:Uncharacterized protein n=1 Tax=Planobispora longispora TaxID=28887 RepID=A0A8J3RTL7_9ACTN|nr:hypothetical protein GCM10020093_108120 [Planobispora longispora]GIH80918.1 hypothetical protein Plo01_73470 [Planobispora longispora]